MATADLPITLNAQDTLTLEHVLNNNNLRAPLAVTLGESCINLDATETASSSTELVVFSDIKIAVLSNIFEQCQLAPSQLSSVNERNNLTSVRFNVVCEDLTQARKALVTICLDEKIEAAIVEQAPSLSSPGLLVMDMDSTTIEIECIDEIAKLAGVGEQVAAVTEEAMQGKLDFAESLNQRVATLEDAPESILADVAKDIPLMPGLTTLIEALKAHNWRIAIASGGFTYFADHLKNTLQLDAARANTLEIVDGKLTGKVLGVIVDAQVKADVLQELAKEFNIAPTQTVAMGDGANDLVMMAAAHLGVAYKAKPLVLAKADSSISHSGLDCMLHWLK
ncbi:MAG: phosphoserine phosphatase SerB [Thalassotalea sp.]|nr:phosphoserine phosphatase SerB [Thalassotalea sp.]